MKKFRGKHLNKTTQHNFVPHAWEVTIRPYPAYNRFIVVSQRPEMDNKTCMAKRQTKKEKEQIVECVGVNT